MACAVGGCAGCAVEVRTADGPAMKRVCVDGPVFDAYTGVLAPLSPSAARCSQWFRPHPRMHWPPPSFDSQPWLEDLAQIRTAVATKYANLEWQVSEREVDLNDLFARAQTRLEQATSAAEARAARHCD